MINTLYLFGNKASELSLFDSYLVVASYYKLFVTGWASLWLPSLSGHDLVDGLRWECA